ncbi:glycoside hydrolase superfamily [Aspergillus varians]
MQKHTQELKTGWFMKEHGDDSTVNSWLPVKQVPSQVHIDLLVNKKIPDPFLDANELSVQWIAEKDWVYQTTFLTPEVSRVTTDLVFHGLDTFATVTLNGTTILSSENMHTCYRVNISNLLKDEGKENQLCIVFKSALLRGQELIGQHPEHTFHVRQTEASRIPVRKAQYNWGWDWGPILMTAGPWRPVVLESYAARVEDIWVQYQVSENLAQCSGNLVARVGGGGSLEDGDTVVFSLAREDGSSELVRQTVHVRSAGEDMVKVAFTIEAPELWYPRGYGLQSRYRLSADYFRGDARLDSAVKLVGLRRCELIQEKDAFGKSFYFRINGIDIFAGGSCWIPPDSFLAQMSRDRYADWMRLLVESNQVMIRVWGGGIYEDDALLDAADELGILVWQDFAFACASYPVFPSFLTSIEEEARQNVRRLRSHPSVIIWAGNNEDYQVQERYKLEYNPENTDPESWRTSTFPARYIYEHLLPKWVHEEDPSAIYHPGSPWGDGKHSADPTVGDIHQWNLWHGQMDRYQDSAHLSGRFISEFGMEAYPHLSTIRRSITNPSQRHPGSMMMDFRNKASDHERRLMTYVSENFLVPSDLESFTHVTQVLQAETMRYAYKAWRRMWGRPGIRRCGGVLVWQLNDCWPTISWAVVDYYGVRKPAFYAIRRALSPLDVGIARECPAWTGGHSDPFSTSNADSCKFDVWVASSLQETVEVDVAVSFISIASGELVGETITTKITAGPNATTEVLESERVKLHAPGVENGQDPFIIHAVIKTADGKVVATDTAWPQPLKYLDFSKRNVKVQISPSSDRITLSTGLPVKGFVFEECEGLKLSDNGFDLVPGEEHVVTVQEGSITEKELGWAYVGANISTS